MLARTTRRVVTRVRRFTRLLLLIALVVIGVTLLGGPPKTERLQTLPSSTMPATIAPATITSTTAAPPPPTEQPTPAPTPSPPVTVPPLSLPRRLRFARSGDDRVFSPGEASRTDFASRWRLIGGYTRRPWFSVNAECVPDWYAHKPLFLNTDQENTWRKEVPVAFGGCEWVNDTHCRFKGGCSHLQIAYNSSIAEDDLTPCNVNHAYANVKHQEGVHDGDRCVPYLFFPLRLPQIGYFPHFFEGALPRLIRALAVEFSSTNPDPALPILMYVPFLFFSADTAALLTKLGIGWTFEYPKNECFRKIAWSCTIVPLDPWTYTQVGTLLREAYEDVRTNVTAPGKRLADGIPNCTKVYASRLNGARNGRWIVNEEQFAAHLTEKHGFIVFKGGEPLDEWARALHDACILLGPHGGAMYHFYWMNRERRSAKGEPPVIIEMDGLHGTTNVLWTQTAVSGFRHAWMTYNQGTGVNFDSADEMLRTIYDKYM